MHAIDKSTDFVTSGFFGLLTYRNPGDNFYRFCYIHWGVSENGRVSACILFPCLKNDTNDSYFKFGLEAKKVFNPYKF